LSRQPTRSTSLISSNIFFFNANHEHRLLELTQSSTWIPSSIEFSIFSEFGLGGGGATQPPRRGKPKPFRTRGACLKKAQKPKL
jgi:hypothetical protein